MTDRHAGYVVSLERDIREDDAKSTIDAIRQIRGVAAVEPIISDVSIHIAESRAWGKWRDALIALIRAGPEATSDTARPKG